MKSRSKKLHLAWFIWSLYLTKFSIKQSQDKTLKSILSYFCSNPIYVYISNEKLWTMIQMK